MSREKFRRKKCTSGFNPPLPQRDTDESTLMAAQNRSTRDPERLFRRAESPAASVCLSLVCSSITSGRLSEEKGKKTTLPPPAEQPLNQNKAGAAAKSWEALLFNAQHPPAGPASPRVPGAGAGARCGHCGGCRAGEEGASSATSPKASLAGGAKISTAPPYTAILLSSAAHQELPFPPSTNVQTKQTKPN